ncbi:hypothetical protein CK203_072172 [Vitis vinifera]|uniref:Uncharacterized protein n=1 Tax=Vitis vinifera TaxID=29760 RepID=A0A438BV23_VITVI|nr:hypothetical protein CK203_072172 [Vitis vinifera]
MAASSSNGVEHVAGDMFTSVPNGDAIFMKWDTPQLKRREVPEVAKELLPIITRQWKDEFQAFDNDDEEDPGPHFHILGQWNENWEPTSKGWNPSLVISNDPIQECAAWSCDELPQRLHLRPYIPLPITRCRNRPDDHPAAYRNFTQFWNRGLATGVLLRHFSKQLAHGVFSLPVSEMHEMYYRI